MIVLGETFYSSGGGGGGGGGVPPPYRRGGPLPQYLCIGIANNPRKLWRVPSVPGSLPDHCGTLPNEPQSMGQRYPCLHAKCGKRAPVWRATRSVSFAY